MSDFLETEVETLIGKKGFDMTFEDFKNEVQFFKSMGYS